MDRIHRHGHGRSRCPSRQAQERERERARHRLACATKSYPFNAQPLRLQRQVGNQEAADLHPNRATAFRRIGAKLASVRSTACTASALPYLSA